MKYVLTALLALSLPTALAGNLRVGATPVPAAEILEFVKPILAKQGVNLTVVEFNDYVQPNIALGDGAIDANLFQHEPYLKAFQEKRPLGIVVAARVYVPPLGVYSRKVKDLQDLKSGSTIAIPNDPTNAARALKLIERAGLIRLDPKAGITATVFDIRSNVKKLKFRELEAAQLPRSLPDVDAAVINTNYALEVGLNPVKDAIFLEPKTSPYANVLATTQAKLSNPDLQKLKKVLLSAETRQFIQKKYGGSIIPVF
ncbi:D-methionine transport system substrate-binding protein [Deinobacterium chartae]|uniref:D-methionine transport system substrate-binding protein n=1 Tax=Deinobacterium chartae TaxID=521158 RepID=A0A841HVS2_9DEIO|nr:MetQ/NlpA family ABC transporter substrate-binding protein [Deinobacterium chartae]MBB6096933.1 D-methionine transport system substrate-binding protein [Deinobacterium chartae]